uniref:Uncharacterized protein n=1 Tax=Rhizophora mucronata TaxID=61149 RepID=A0A2P2NJ67_RHIMU
MGYTTPYTGSFSTQENLCNEDLYALCVDLEISAINSCGGQVKNMVAT